MTGFDFNSPGGVKAAVECHFLIVSAGFGGAQNRLVEPRTERIENMDPSTGSG